LPFEKVLYKEPQFYFVKKDFELQNIYDSFIKINELFPLNGAGIVTKRDAIAYQFSKKETEEVVNNIYTLSCEDIKKKYQQVSWESRDGKVEFCKNSILEKGLKEELYVQCSYRPFDYRWTYYTGISKGFIGWPVKQVMKHFLNKANIGLVVSRQSVSSWKHIFITKLIGEFNLTGSAGSFGSGYYHPLYLYPDENTLETQRTPNLNQEIVAEIEKSLNLTFTPEKEEDKTTFAPIDILDYIYAVLHSPRYREKYKEFLKIDFPRVPYPDSETFWQLVELGSQLRALHLLEDKSLDERIIDISGEGEMHIANRLNKEDVTILDDTVMLNINENISIINIPLVAWEFYIGGYQPAQKWLKDRVGRELSRADLKHYNKIINALIKTDVLMKEIDEVMKS
jgi:predicted helicase